MMKPTKLTLRLHPDHDADLIHWLASLDALPYGQKGRVIKEALRRGLGQEQKASLDAEALLADLRTVVEMAVQQALASATILSSHPHHQSDDPDETDALLDQLGDQLML
jgi:hypothetical protein